MTLVLPKFIPYRVVLLGRKMSEKLADLYKDEGVSIPEWRVLAVIAQHDDVAARDVVEQTPMDKMAVSRAAASLEVKEIVARQPCAGDARVSRLRLTQKGRSLFDRIATIALQFEEELFNDFTDHERKLFKDMLDRLDRVSSGKR